MLARLAVVAVLAALFVPEVDAAPASAPPVGPLPPGQITTVSASRGTLVAVVLPGQPASGGRVWRLARRLDARVLRQVSEGNLSRDIVVIYKAVGPGSVTVAYGLTKGETRKAYKAVTYKISIR
jgi:hypothetical protein